MRSAKEDDTCTTKPAIDLVSAVEEFHKLSIQDLSKLIREAENGTIKFTKHNGSLLEINMESLAKNLAVHLISRLLSFKRGEQHLRYLLAGVRLLHGLYDLASRHSKLEQVLVEDVTILEMAFDLIFFTIVFLSNFRQKLDKTLLPSALLASSFYLLPTCISSQWDDLTNVLLAHPKVDVFTSIAFPAVRVVINSLQVKLSAQLTDTPLVSNDDELHRLCLHSEASVHFIHSLCQQKLFRERLVENKELCKEGGVLLLVQDIMKLPQCEDSHLMSVVSWLKSKILSIMLLLCEVESISFLDSAASTTEGLDLAKSTISEVLEMLRIMFSGDVNGYNPRGMLQLNAMRLTEILSDDSNFRPFIISNFAEVLTRVFLVPHGEFLSSWCSSDSEPADEDVNLNYDSYSAAGQVLGVMSASRGSKSAFNTSRASETPYAHQKTSLLVKIVANLTCFVPDLCKEERGLFLNKFFQCMQKEIPNLQDDGAERAVVASKNLLSLLVHTGSLTHGNLNEDDVTLLRLFITQLEKLITPQEAKDVDSRGQCSSPGPERASPDSGGRGVDESERDANNIERIGSDLSDMQLQQNASDGMNNVEGVPEEETVRSGEKQLKKRKRNIMNDVQIAMIENALQDEPHMQRRAASIQLWADKLSLHGSEITSSQLKNWLNNRKAKLARAAAKHGPVSSSGNGLTDKQGGGSDSPESPADEPPSYGPHQTDGILRICGNDSSSVPTSSLFRRQHGQHVVLVDGKGEEIGNGSIHLAKGIWFGRHLEESGLCVVDVTHLKVDASTQLPHPCDATGTTFGEAQIILGRKRILWDSTKLLLIQHQLSG